MCDRDDGAVRHFQARAKQSTPTTGSGVSHVTVPLQVKVEYDHVGHGVPSSMADQVDMSRITRVSMPQCGPTMRHMMYKSMASGFDP